MKEIIFKIIFIVSLAGLLVIVFLKLPKLKKISIQEKTRQKEVSGAGINPPVEGEKKEENTEEPKDNFWQKLKEE